MKAFRLIEWGHAPELVDVEVPQPGPGEVLIRVAGNGLCHSDITMMQMPGEIGEALGWHMPFTLGHESAGHVASLGDGVVGVEVGAAVALMSANSCGRCRPCQRGEDSLCTQSMFGRGYGRDGGLAEFVLARADRDLVPLGSLDPVAAGTLTDAGATSYHAVSRVLPRLGPGTTVGVIGIGGLGSFAVQLLATLSEASIVAVDASPERRARALELGAAHVIDGVDRGTRRALAEFAGPEGLDVVLDIVGNDQTIDVGIRSVRPGGAFALVGSAGGTLNRPWFSTLPREAEVFTFQGSRISHVHEVVHLAAEGRITIDAQLFGLSEVETAYEQLEAGTLSARAVIVP